MLVIIMHSHWAIVLTVYLKSLGDEARILLFVIESLSQKKTKELNKKSKTKKDQFKNKK